MNDENRIEEGPHGLAQIQFNPVQGSAVVWPLLVEHTAVHVYIMDSTQRTTFRPVLASALIQCADHRTEAAQWLLDYCVVRFGR